MKPGLRLIQRMTLLTMLSLMTLLGMAQSNLVFYNSNDQYNSPAFNPAFLTNQQKFTFSIFPLSGMSVGYNNQEMVKGMLKDLLSGDLDTANMKTVFNSLLKKDLFSQRFETSLLNLGYHSAIGAFNFRINEVEQIRTGLKGDITAFMSTPEFMTVKLNQPQRLNADVVHYREFSLGFASEIIKNKLSIGIRPKIYFGKASLFSEVPGEMTGKNNTFYMETLGPVKTSLPVVFTTDNDSIITGAIASDSFTFLNYFFNTQNMGIGIDFGFTYKINSQIDFSASIFDLGKINWNNNLSRLNLEGQYEILPQYLLPTQPGDDFITKSPTFSIDEGDLNQLFKSVIDTTTVYSTALPTSFFASLQYQMNPMLTLGVVDRYTQSKGMSQNSVSLTANYEVNKKLTLISGYSSIGKSYNNIPFALIYNWVFGQSYLGTDNLLAFFLPSNADYAGISFGTCFYLFRPKEKYKQSEYLPFYKEKKHNIFNN